MLDLFALTHARQQLLFLQPAIERNQHAHVAADRLVCPVAVRLFRRPVPRRDPPPKIHADDRVIG
jgi:hypothetical protein